jgi:putative tricarboxylic transport membrane protein
VGRVGQVRLVAGVLALLALLVALPAGAQPLYAHLRIVAPAAPGGGWDQTARAMQQVLQTSGIAATSSVENIPGAAGTIGLARLIDAERGNGDVVMISGLIMLAAIVSHDSPVTLRDVTPIARLTGEYEVLVVPARSPYRTLPDLLSAFRARPESIAWAGGSAGGTDQILAGMIAEKVGVSPRRVNYVAFAGGGESMAAILGGQVTVGISGLGEYAAQIAAGSVRILAISSAERLTAVDAPTLREQGVDVVLENWRSLVAPPGIGANDRSRLERAMAAMVRSSAWQQTLRRFRWNDRYLAGESFARFVTEEEARVHAILREFGDTTNTAPSSVGPYAVFVVVGLIVTIAIGVRKLSPSSRTSSLREDAVPGSGALTPGGLNSMRLVIAAAVLDVVLIERAGFILASVPLFWLTARAFDPKHPLRDAVAAIALAIGAYVLFARLLQISLPAGVLARWI